MKRILGFNSISVSCLLFVVFAVSRFLYFDADRLLPEASVYYGKVAASSGVQLPDSLLSRMSSEMLAVYQKENCLGTVASACVWPFFISAKKLSGTSALNKTILVGMELGALLFIALSIWFTRKFLLNYFDEIYSAVFLLVIFLATPIFTSFSLNLWRSELIEFCFISGALAILSNIRKDNNRRDLILFTFLASIACLLNPAAIFLLPLAIFFIPTSGAAEKEHSMLAVFRSRLLFFNRSPKTLFLGMIAIIFISFVLGWISNFSSEPLHQFDELIQRAELFPQLLLSYRKGVLLYSPVLFLALAGLVFYYIESRFNAILITFISIVSIVTLLIGGTWWSKTAFSVPELLGLVPLFIFPLNALINKCRTQGEVASGILSLALLFALFYTQFFTWQIGNSILKPHKLDQAYFNQVVFELNEPEELNFNRILKKGLLPKDKLKYSSQILYKTDFTSETEYVIYDLNNPYHRVNQEIEYALNRKFEVVPGQFRKDALLEIKFRYRMSVNACNVGPFIVMDIESSKERYGYMNFFMESDASDHWRDFNAIYKIPDIKFSGDLLNFYVWNNGKCYIDVDNIQLTVYQPKAKSNSNDLFLIN